MSALEVPQLDERAYHAATLSNGLDCLLISDPASDKAAAALSVAVGQLQDPHSYPGIAHLLEHAIFLGTKDFPVENEYDRYLSQHGGHSNAYTDLELTCYFCDCQSGALEGALHRFGACLTSPLLLADSLEREIQAVDSEHAKNKQQDHWRSHQISKSILGGGGDSASREQHPYAGFGSGNIDVLLGEQSTVKSEQDKAERIQLLREQVVAFYERYYKASSMKLVILGREDVNKLKNLAERYFGRIPTASETDRAHCPDPIPPLPLVPTVVHWVPVRECHILELQWILPELHSLYRLKPGRYLSHLLGHEGAGSLLQVLRDRQWAQELSADDISKATSAFTVFDLQIELTPLGFTHIDQIIQMVYGYIGLMNQIPSWVHGELAETAEMQFRFLSQREPSDTASMLAVNMQHYAVEHYLSGPYKIYDFDQAQIEACWECLRPDNMVIMIAAKEFIYEADKTCPWYGTQYKVLPQAEMSRIQELVSCPCADESLTKQLSLPERNDMLATEFDVLETQYDCFKTTEATPRCIVDTEICRLWYKPDTVFGMPKVNAMFLIRTPLVSGSPHAAVLASLWTEVIHEFCNEFAYVAYMAGLHCDFSSNNSGVEITVSGYNHKAYRLVDRICKTITAMPTRLTTEVFERIHDKLEKRYLAFLVEQPYQQAISGADQCLESYKWSIQKRLACLQNLKTKDLINFHTQLLSRFYLEALVHGNVPAKQAIEWTNILIEAFKPLPLLHRSTLRVVSLSSDTLYQCKGWNEDDDNSVVVNLFQIGPTDLKSNAMLSLLQHLVREPAFNQLRTEEQLGYIVHTSVKTNGERIKGLLFLIQSDAFGPQFMDERIEAFLVRFRTMLVQMSTADFSANVDAVCHSLLEKNKNLFEESSKHWHVITNRSYNFCRRQELAAQAKGFSKSDALRFFDKYILQGSPFRRKLAVHVYGNKTSLVEQAGGFLQLVEDPEEFVRNQTLYPVQATLSVEEQMLNVDA